MWVLMTRLNLRHRDPECRGRHEPQDAQHRLVARIPPRHREHADALEERNLEEELREPADEDAPRERDDGPLEMRGGEKRERDERNIQQHRREGRPLNAP
jgi:hypothetical protein